MSDAPKNNKPKYRLERKKARIPKDWRVDKHKKSIYE